MNRLLPLFITTSAVVLSFSFTGVASAADSYDLMADCLVSTSVPDKCGLSIALAGDNTSNKATLKKVIFRINGKPVYAAYNDKSPLLINTFAAFSIANSIPVPCSKTYIITAHVVKANSTAETKVGDSQPVVCPAKATF
jgi:hypothetical protein